MRITNKMMTNNMLYNINSNKKHMSALENKYSTGLEIQRPSDDPIVAVRALKLRTNLSELNQYYEKNIPDAKSWMETTESALKVTSQIITQIHTYCVQGANDTLTEKDRNSIAANLKELKQQIYQEGNSNYAGRYLFTGYKTNTPLVFDHEDHNTQYTITETIKAEQLEISDRVIDSIDLEEFELDDAESYEIEQRPNLGTIYRMRLSYDKLKTIEDGGSISLKIPEKDADGNYVYDDDGELQYSDELDDSNMNVFTSDNPLAYKPAEDEINYIEDTGEIIFGSAVYNQWRESDFEVTYVKNSFSKNDLRPEHYFNCVAEDLTIGDEAEREAAAIQYTVEDQQICYEVNFNQRMAINVQGRDAFSHSLGRTIDDIVKAINDVDRCKEKIAKVDKMLKDTSLSEEQTAKLNEIRDVLKTELDLKDSMMRKAYERGLTSMSLEEDRVNVATADIGTRYNRIELTEDRLSTQQVEFTDLLSQNEDADLVDTVVNYNAAQTIYNASLSAASKVVKNTLLDFL
ncbi:MAG: flagellar hook-associated protein FlgL [Lachnospiraceae bacterium]|nr:flagellar hook-associated protein FlgL [Lachnospiraceae bacterium]